MKQFLEDAPIPDQAKGDRQPVREPKDYLPGLTSDEKKAKLARMSYADFLTDVVKVRGDHQVVPDAAPLFGVGIDAVSAQDAWGFEHAGLRRDETGSRAGQGHEP